MKDDCSISDLFLMLKLGLFNSAKVKNKGCFSLSKTNDVFLKKPFSAYENQLYAKKQLSIGLFLLDSFLLSRNTNIATYILVISVCRTTLEKKEQIYVIKLSEVPANTDIMHLLSESEDGFFPQRKRKSMFRKKSRRPYFEFSPLNSSPRKY